MNQHCIARIAQCLAITAKAMKIALETTQIAHAQGDIRIFRDISSAPKMARAAAEYSNI